MPKDKKVKEIVKVEYKEKIIDNSKKLRYLSYCY